MAQEMAFDPGQSACAFVRQGAERVLALEGELTDLEAKFADPAYYTHEPCLARLLDQQEKFLEAYNQLGGPGLDGQVRALLMAIGFEDHEVTLPVEHLSGGQKKLLGLARIMVGRPDILLLDEPTNHLDIPSCEVLEDALLDFDGTILAISHDRYFLDRIVSRILYLHEAGIDSYLGNYSDYEHQRLEKLCSAP
jgi:ATP-binding cassette subfamily F protein 3